MVHRIFSAVPAILLCLVFVAAPARASDGAEGFIRKMGSDAVATVNADKLGDREREQRFARIFREAFAVPAIGRFVLGRYWHRANEGQRGEYLKLFQHYIVRTYTDRFKGYKGVSFKVGDAKPVKEGEWLVPSEVTRPGGEPPIAVQWRVRGTKDKFKIVDVIAEGVSMLISQRDEFGAIVSRNDGKVGALIAELKRRTGES